MKIKDGFVLRQVAGQGVVIATGEASKEFSGMVKLTGPARSSGSGLPRASTRMPSPRRSSRSTT